MDDAEFFKLSDDKSEFILFGSRQPLAEVIVPMLNFANLMFHLLLKYANLVFILLYR